MPVRILVVDDNPDIANSLGKLLTILGCICRVAYEGKTALEIAVVFHADMVISDLAMPEMSGFEFVERLRSMWTVPQPLAVAHSAHDDCDHRARAKIAGFDHFFVKPMAATSQEFLE